MLAVPRQPATFVTPQTILTTYEGLVQQEPPGSSAIQKTRARFMVLAASGVRPSELMRTEPGDVDLERRVWRTRDGKGGYRPGGLYLTADLLGAWQLFVAAKAWGPFNTGSFAKRLRSAGWPEGVRPYQLRHTVGLALSEAGVDLADVSALAWSLEAADNAEPLRAGARFAPAGRSFAHRQPHRLDTRAWHRR
jgi:integrase